VRFNLPGGTGEAPCPARRKSLFAGPVPVRRAAICGVPIGSRSPGRKKCRSAGEAPGLLRDAAQNQFPEFISTADFIEDGEDGPASIRRILGDFPAAAE
jgi:hypothetical protein